MPRNRIDRQPTTASPRLSSVPRVRYLLPALAVALSLIAGCASAAPTIATHPPSASPPSASPAGYACSTADIFSQPVGVRGVRFIEKTVASSASTQKWTPLR